MLNAKSLFENQKTICKKNLSKYAKVTEELKVNKPIQKVESSFYAVFHILEIESHASRIETVEYGIDILNEMLRFAASEDKVLAKLLRLYIYQSTQVTMSSSAFKEKLSEGLLKGLGDSIQLIRINPENSKNMVTVTLEIGIQLERMTKAQNTPYLYGTLGLLPRIVERFDNTIRPANMMIREMCKKIQDPEPIIITSLFYNLSSILTLSSRFYDPQDFAKFEGSIISTLNSIRESTIVLRRKQLDESQSLYATQRLFDPILGMMMFVFSFLFELTPTRQLRARVIPVYHFRLVIESVFSILKNLTQFAIRFEMITFLLPLLSKNLIDLLYLIIWSNRIGDVQRSTYDEIFQLSLSIDNLLLKKDSSLNVIYLNLFSKEIRLYLRNRHGVMINQTYLTRILHRILGF
jgi:hypothetical protein